MIDAMRSFESGRKHSFDRGFESQRPKRVLRWIKSGPGSSRYVAPLKGTNR
jgi:hypothetical protein